MIDIASSKAAEILLHQCVEQILAERFIPHAPIARILRERSEFSSSYASDVVTVQLASGDAYKIFLKDFGVYRHPKDHMQERRERELRVYRDLLVNTDLDTAAYYGSVWNASQERFWLLLEFVPGLPVQYYDYEFWVPAAAWLGRLAGHFAQRQAQLEHCDFLIRHDASFFHSTAESALRAVFETVPHLAGRLAAIVRRYDELVHVMARQPKSLVHGTYRAVQIVFDGEAAPPRMCPVDWEMAAIGSNLYDLAFFVDGFGPPRLDQLIHAFHSEARKHGAPVPGPDQIKHIVHCYRLHRVMDWLSMSVSKKYTGAVIAGLVDLADQIAPLCYEG